MSKAYVSWALFWGDIKDTFSKHRTTILQQLDEKNIEKIVLAKIAESRLRQDKFPSK